MEESGQLRETRAILAVITMVFSRKWKKADSCAKHAYSENDSIEDSKIRSLNVLYAV